MLLRWFEHSQVYHPQRRMDASGAELGRPFEDVGFQSGDGVALNGWFFPAADRAARRGRLVFLVCHGNGGNISHRLDLYRALLETGAGVFAFDYRGYGRSGGRPSEEGTYRDAQAARAWLTQRHVAGPDILVYGESLGGAIAAELCRREAAGGLVLQSTFTSIRELGEELFPWLPVRHIASMHYDTRRTLSQLTVPVLILHSRADGLINFRHAERLFAAAKEPKLLWEIQGRHSDPLAERPRFIQGIEKFLNLIEPAPAS